MSVGTGSLQNSRILLVDDDSDFRAMIQSVLPKEVFMTSAGTIGEAEALLGKEQFDLILLDLSLPDGEGLKFCSRIRQDESYRSIPMIMLTGSSEIDDKVIAFQLGVDDYLVKPFDLREFKARVISRLRRARDKAGRRSDVLCWISQNGNSSAKGLFHAEWNPGRDRDDAFGVQTPVALGETQ